MNGAVETRRPQRVTLWRHVYDSPMIRSDYPEQRRYVCEVREIGSHFNWGRREEIPTSLVVHGYSFEDVNAASEEWYIARREVDPEQVIVRPSRFSRTLRSQENASVNLDGLLAIVLCLTEQTPKMAFWFPCTALDPEDGVAYEAAGFAERGHVGWADYRCFSHSGLYRGQKVMIRIVYCSSFGQLRTA